MPGGPWHPGPARPGVPGWASGYDVARANYVPNLIEPWGDVVTSEDELVSGPDSESGEGLFWQKPRPIGVMWRG